MRVLAIFGKFHSYVLSLLGIEQLTRAVRIVALKYAQFSLYVYTAISMAWGHTDDGCATDS